MSGSPMAGEPDRIRSFRGACLFSRMQSYWKTLKRTVTEFVEDNVLRLSAALAYYSVFSLAPLLVICVAVAGAFLGEEAVRGELSDQLKSSLGASGAFAVQEMVAQARKPEANVWVSIGGFAMLFVGASGLFGQLQDALNTVWGVKQKPGRGVAGILKDRFLSFLMVLGTGFLLLISMVLSAVLQAMGKWVGEMADLPPEMWAVASELASFAVVVLLFAAIFKVLPDVQVRWEHVWIGAIFTAALFVAGKSAIAWYLGREATASSYGTAGSLALVLLWVYYSSIILLFGAEFTQVWAKRQGEEIRPDRDAVAVGDPISDNPR